MLSVFSSYPCFTSYCEYHTFPDADPPATPIRKGFLGASELWVAAILVLTSNCASAIFIQRMSDLVVGTSCYVSYAVPGEGWLRIHNVPYTNLHIHICLPTLICTYVYLPALSYTYLCLAILTYTYLCLAILTCAYLYLPMLSYT